jgi:arylamine N-acetyltransferase
MSNTHTYSEDQITAYFERIKVPDGERIYSVQSLSPEEQLRYLAKLQKYHLAEVPFENLTLHYSFHRQVSIDPDDLFKKVVGDNNGRGGYCMENNYVLGTLLRSLGFQIYSAGARVFDDGNWSGW